MCTSVLEEYSFARDESSVSPVACCMSIPSSLDSSACIEAASTRIGSSVRMDHSTGLYGWVSCIGSLRDDCDRRTFRRPRVQELCDVQRKVNAPVAHRLAEVFVPVGAVDSVPEIIEIHHPGDVFDTIGLVVDDALHRLLLELGQNGVVA